MSLPLPPEFGRPQPDDIVRIIEGVAFIEKQPLDFDPIQNAQWAMDRLCMVYRMELQGENTENGKNRTLRLWHVRRSRAVLGLSVAVSGWSTAQPGVRRSGERASE